MQNAGSEESLNASRNESTQNAKRAMGEIMVQKGYRALQTPYIVPHESLDYVFQKRSHLYWKGVGRQGSCDAFPDSSQRAGEDVMCE